MAKAFDEETNQLLRALAREVIKTKCDGLQWKLAEMIDVSPSFVSDFVNEKRGAGLEMLTGLGRLAPLEFLKMLGIDPGVVAALYEGQASKGVDLMSVPDVVRRAARAVIELEGCTPAAAGDAALEMFAQWGNAPDTDVDWWVGKIRKRLTEVGKSGERESVRIKTARESDA